MVRIDKLLKLLNKEEKPYLFIDGVDGVIMCIIDKIVYVIDLFNFDGHGFRIPREKYVLNVGGVLYKPLTRNSYFDKDMLYCGDMEFKYSSYEETTEEIKTLFKTLTLLKDKIKFSATYVENTTLEETDLTKTQVKNVKDIFETKETLAVETYRRPYLPETTLICFRNASGKDLKFGWHFAFKNKVLSL